MIKDYYVYILTNYNETTSYVGMTSYIEKRMYEHKHKLFKGFSSKYNLTKLVYYEQTNLVEEAILREKKLKKWKRDWKLDLIKNFNSEFLDLSDNLIDSASSAG